MKHIKKLAHLLIVLIACFTLFCISLYWIFSSTLLNPALFDDILDNEHTAYSIEDAADYMAQNGIIIEKQSLKDNLLSLIDGVIRYITREDMSFSDITINNGYVESSRWSALAETYDKTRSIPNISRIHPFMMSYFIPGSETVYSYLQLVRNSYALLHALCPVLALFILLILLLDKRSGKIICKSSKAAAFLLVASGLFIKLIQNCLFISPAKSVFWDFALIFKPVISKITVKVSLYFLAAGIFFAAISLVFSLKPVCGMINKASKKISAMPVLVIVALFILNRHDITASVVHNVANVSQTRHISTLAQNDAAVHSLVLKLKEEGTEKPVRDITIIANKADYPYNPLYVSAVSDFEGNTRFILPHGIFLVYADESKLPSGLKPFEPVIIRLDMPGNSWYTIYLAKEEKPIAPPSNQPGKPVPYPY